VFARDCDPSVRLGLQPLIELRKKQAGDLFKLFEGPSAPAPGEPAVKWINRNGATLDVVDPSNGIPYFLLLVGSPESITFEFQYTLDIYWCGTSRQWGNGPGYRSRIGTPRRDRIRLPSEPGRSF
jgi:hypothetical protein